MGSSPWFLRFTLDDPVLGRLDLNRLGPAIKKIGWIIPGTAVQVLTNGRIRHCIVEEVTDQDRITVRLGGNSEGTEFVATRQVSTITRGTLFVEETP